MLCEGQIRSLQSYRPVFRAAEDAEQLPAGSNLMGKTEIPDKSLLEDGGETQDKLMTAFVEHSYSAL